MPYSNILNKIFPNIKVRLSEEHSYLADVAWKLNIVIHNVCHLNNLRSTYLCIFVDSTIIYSLTLREFMGS